MRWILSLCFIVQFMGAKEITEALQAMQFDTTKQDLLREAVGEFYTQKRVYMQNNYRIRDKMLIALQQKETNLTRYVESLKEVSEQYILAKIAFYREVVGILGEKQTEKLIEMLNE
ncbi:hypothetical protein [Helicobacter winghamensis]|uniref:Spy/CpxP family protein refolding chaperone n=1 Tax=Helicobacter winghamensis TaxID=157268 RepID=A0A2N3PJ58_9HELI|nr:hypothetical protein [Helicobacter winghamensis]EEO25491.1 hypothetical protein HWAG_00283 [Helicobacter winghamensis ATCC BAA-430]PKT78086.1 hypothetical protein BCM34_02435 [Helicobacter winghamensis]PKT78351.1 hypothetical protein BCM32_01190 [Helicobacter winghamensis]PKT78614.1 hypothetical protein BCM35_00725 [Helicobacter winghamensis]PKT81035.1 hypothetical protein BCM31_04420 [Helicobacter winghamensis]